jgi:hypothetical protein
VAESEPLRSQHHAQLGPRRTHQLFAQTGLELPVHEVVWEVVELTAKRLSRRPLKRIVRFEIQLGPYSVLYRDGKQRPREHYVIWTAELPCGNTIPGLSPFCSK